MHRHSWAGLLFAPAFALVAACEGELAQAPTGPAAVPAEGDPGLRLYGFGSGGDIGRHCDSRPYRQFDFWLGNWDVTDQDGADQGTNRITRELDGCAVSEDYAAGGFVGRSLNSYDAANRQWHQHWVDHTGLSLLLDGGFQGGAMILQAARPSLGGRTVIDRIKWSLLPGGIVRQFWDQSLDGGQTFALFFDGRYTRVPSVVPDPEVPTAACNAPDRPVFRQFDFTLGDWKVRVLGRELRSSITNDLSTCLIEERLTGDDGYEARIFSSARRITGVWYRTLVDNRGTRIFLTGSEVDGRMVLTGTMPLKGKLADVRVTWQPVAGGFTEAYDTSKDGGATWKPLLVVRYEQS
jgi:hypothetical protein